MILSNTVDYIHSVFEYPVLTKITGRPTYSSLKIIKNELKANAGKVQCELGGGNNGHLGLVLSDIEYALVNPTVPYVRPAHPGPNAPVGTTQLLNTNLREQYKEDTRIFREANQVEAAIIKQLADALPPHYLKKYRNQYSNQISTHIRVILAELFKTYGAITEEQLAEKEATLRAHIFDIAQPLVELFNSIEELQEIATASESPYTDKQLVSLGMKLIRNMNDYEKARGEWMAKTSVNKNWTNFKNHFDDAYQYLINLRGDTMQSTSFQQHANLLRQQLHDLNQKREEDKSAIVQMVDDAKSSILSAISTPSLQLSEESVSSDITSPTLPSVNSVHQDNVQLKMLQILEQIDSKLDGKLDSKEPDTKRARTRRVLDSYCWTHGAGNHKSCACRTKKEGHKDNATLDNRMDGNNAYCKLALKNK